LRVQAFIDGFNLYHAIDSLTKNDTSKKYYKWVNLHSLMEAFIKPSQETLNNVFYFSAHATWRPSSHIKHRTYVNALKAYNVDVILGHFKKKNMKCRSCNIRWETHEEKESDVNLCIHLLQNAHLDNFDKALIVTSDSDMVPVIEMIKTTFPHKEIVVLTPPNRYQISHEIRSTVTTLKIKEKHIKNNILPNTITFNGIKIIKPTDW